MHSSRQRRFALLAAAVVSLLSFTVPVAARADGDETTWKVLGASRGEGGILGQGVRQALLRDPTYSPALACARVFCG